MDDRRGRRLRKSGETCRRVDRRLIVTQVAALEQTDGIESHPKMGVEL